MPKIKTPRVKQVEETHIGKILANDPEARKRHDEIVAALQEDAREEIEAIERSERRLRRDNEILY